MMAKKHTSSAEPSLKLTFLTLKIDVFSLEDAFSFGFWPSFKLRTYVYIYMLYVQ